VHGVQGQISDILTPASYESLPSSSGHTGDLFASVDALLCLPYNTLYAIVSEPVIDSSLYTCNEVYPMQ
jgi:hypothetical protein